MKIYQYPVCSTCKHALKFLDASEIDYEHFFDNVRLLIAVKSLIVACNQTQDQQENLARVNG